ncbi:MAG: hypothetical protein ACXVEF_42335 [Polyangiales bacterium]
MRKVVLGLIVALTPGEAAAEEQQPTCEAWDVEYALNENLTLVDTPMGKGDGLYHVGPGSTVLRFDPSGNVKMLSYAMRESFKIHIRFLLSTTDVVVDSRSRVTPNTCGVAAEGRLTGNKIVWTTKVRGHRADGTVNCSGTCGKFGAPPEGPSGLEIPPHDVVFKPFELSKDQKTFEMQSTFVSKTELPKQTAYIALSGREVRRTCVQPKPCP